MAARTLDWIREWKFADPSSGPALRIGKRFALLLPCVDRERWHRFLTPNSRRASGDERFDADLQRVFQCLHRIEADQFDESGYA